MAANVQRDNAIPQRRPRTINTQTPLFVKKEREPLPYGIKAYTEEGVTGGSGSESSSSQSVATSGASQSRGGGWLSGKNRRSMGLGEAFLRTDENGVLRPRTAQGVVRSNGDEQVVSPATASRIPRSMTYSSGTPLASSPPRIIKETYTRAEWDERNTPAPDDNGSESSGPREGSPSPAPNPRGRRHQEIRRDEVPAPRNNVVEDAELDEYARKRERLEQARARMKRAAADPRPIFPPRYPSENQVPFVPRGYVESRIAETTRTQARKTSTSNFEDAGVARKLSISSFDDEPEPPIRVPRAWTHAKPYPRWIQKIISPDDSLEMKDPPVISEEPQSQAPPDVPLPSVELGASAQEPTPPTSRPTSARPSNDFLGRSPEKSRLWDADIDFTARSLQLSESPMLRVKPSRLDEIREREIQSLSARAVATNRLEEIRERNSEERSVKESTPKPEQVNEPKEEVYYERTILEEEGYPIPGTPITVFPNGSYRPSSSSSSNSGNPPEDSYEVLRKLSRVLSQSPAPQPRLDEDEEEDEKHRESQMDKETELVKVEKKPAKALKRSKERSDERPKEMKIEELVEVKPTEEKLVEETVEKMVEKMVEKFVEETNEKPVDKVLERINEFSHDYTRNRSRNRNGSETDVQTKRRSTASTPPKSDVDPEERITAEAKLFELQDNRSEKNSIRAPSRSPSPSNDQNLDETPRPRADPLSLPTPKVTGAFIETPAPSTRKPQKQRSISPSYELVDSVGAVPSSEDQQPQRSSRESSTSQTDSKRNPRSRETSRPTAYGHTRDTSRSTSLHREVTERQLPFSRPTLINTAKVTTAAEDLRRLQLEAGVDDSTLDDFETLYQHDAAYTARIRRNSNPEPVFHPLRDERDLAVTLAERERQKERVLLARMEQRLRNTSTSIRDARHGIERLEHEVSSAPSTRNMSQTVDRHYIKIEMSLPRLWVNKPVTISNATPQARGRFGEFAISRNWKFTWLGLILAIFAAWFLTESFVCGVYCHPDASSTNTWHPSDPFFPWAIPTKLDQWTGEVVSGTAKSVKNSLDDWLDPEGLRYGRIPKMAMGANDWWLGRSGPAGIVRPDNDDSIFNDDYD